MRRIFLFDIDGTLTPHRLPMTEEFYDFFLGWASKNKFYLTTGSDIEKVKEQIPVDILDLSKGIFCCMGNQLLKESGDRIVYTNNFEPTKDLTDTLQSFLDYSDFPFPWREGPHIELRPGMINFSIVGRGVDLEMRRIYSRFDEGTMERERLVGIIRNKYPLLDASIGGKISIDIYPRGNDKSQSVDWIMRRELPNYIIFVGDRAFPGGNDYAVCEALAKYNRGVWFNVNSEKETRAILNISNLYTNEDGRKT